MNLLPCPSLSCSLPVFGPIPGQVVRAGFYRNGASRRRIQRYRCKNCGCSFSEQTHSSVYRQRRVDLNLPIRDLLCSNVSQRRCAKLLGVSRRTILRKFRFMARQASIENEKRREVLKQKPLSQVQFDDLITVEHTKCKPLSVSLAVDPETREILGTQVSRIPARHPLSELSLRKYGPRVNERAQGLNRLFSSLQNLIQPLAHFKSDQDPGYPEPLSKYFPLAHHERIKSRRGRSDGFGELKRIGHDPLFSLNHTCGMFRANINRLARRTWCISKTKLGLILHLELYTWFHNFELLDLGAA